MKKIYKLFCLVVFAMLAKALPTDAQTTVFLDTFDAEIFPGGAGTPTAFYFNDVSDFTLSNVQVGGTDVVTLTAFDPLHLTAWSNPSFGGDYAYTTAPLSGYAAPFTPILSALPGIITWEFNMRANIPSNGDFDFASNESAVILAGSDPFFIDAGVGYAVTFTQNIPYSVQLVRYSAGLYGSLPVTILTGAVTMASGTDYVSVRVTFDPASSKWSLYMRDDGPTAFASPFSGVTSLLGSTVDMTYISGFPALTNFGFFSYNDLPFSDLGFTEFDNFRVRVDCGIPLITGADSVCVGSSTTLANTSPGGTWMSLSTGIATVGASTGVVTGVAPGTAVIRYTTTVVGCYRDTVVKVRPLPNPITGLASICEGATTTLASTTTGGIWSTSDASIASITTGGVVTGVLAGTTLIQYTDPVTRCAATQIETVNPQPGTITGPGVVCQAATITLSNATTGGTWSSSATGVATVGAASGIVTGVSGGTATISYIMTGTSCFTTTVVTVNASPAITAGSNIACLGGPTVTLTGSPSGGTWGSSNTAVATIGASSGIITAVSAGTTTITYTNATTGCFITRTEFVNTTPAAITGTAVVCQGSITTLSTTSTGGFWNSGNTGVATVPFNPGAVTGVAGGTATISYTVSGCSTTRVVTVNPLPAVITGSASVCLGTTSTLSSITPGGNWTSLNTGVATIGVSNGVVNGLSVGTSTISYTLPATGCARSVIVSVNPLPAAITGTLIVCQGSNTTLDDATTGGNWTSGNTAIATVGATTGIVTGVAAGTATISYSSPTTCATTAIVTVNPQPALIGGSSAVCLGSSVTLSNTTPGGTWSSTNTAVATIGSSTGAVNGVAAGTSTISYTLTATGCARTTVMTVNPLPQPITGPATVCVGSVVTVSTTSTGGNWFSSNGAVATVGMTTGAITGVGAGTTTISYIFPATGCFITTVETVNATPSSVITVLGGDSVLCPGDFAVLTASSGSGFMYQWYVGGLPIPGAVSSTYTAGAAGAYQVTITNGAGCNATSIPKNISVNPVSASITTAASSFVICTGNSVTLDASTGVGLTYQWELAGAPIAGVTTTSYTVSAGGDYSVVITNAAGCSASASVTVTANPTPAGNVTLSGPLSICTGASVTMTADAGLTYQWFNASGAIPGATNVSYTATVAGNYYVTETNSFGCSATSPTNVVIVNTLPGAGISHFTPTIFCAGGNVLLDAPAGGGLTYQWYRNGTAVAGATNANYLASTSGNYRVRVTNSTTGCSAMTAADTIVTSVAAANILPLTPATFCWGGSSLLGASVSGPGTLGVTYQWYFGGVPIVGAVGPTYNTSVPGSYSLVIAIPSSCTYTTTGTTVTEKPLPNPIVAYNSGTHVLSAQTYYLSYQWFKDLAPIPGATAATTIATGNAYYKVQVTDSNGCQSFSSAYPLTSWTGGGGTAVTNVNTTDIKVYPNPAQSSIFVEAGMQVRAVISSVDGRDVTEQSGNGTIEIDLKGLADGIYMLRIFHGDEQVKVEKVVKSTR